MLSCITINFTLSTVAVIVILDVLLQPIHCQDKKSLPYSQWLQQWQINLTPIPLFNNIPLAACSIHTPLNSDAWLHHLRHHPQQDLVQYFSQSIIMGFRLGSSGSTIQSAKKNLKSAAEHPTVIDNYLQKEVTLGRLPALTHHQHAPMFTSIDLG